MSYPRYEAYKASEIEWVGQVPLRWQICPLFTVMQERGEQNLGNREQNVLSLSYGRIVRRNVDNNFGLLPESFETYQIVEPGNVILRLTDLQNDQRSLRVGLARERGIITSAYLCLEPQSNIDDNFAYYLLHSYDICKVFYGFGGGVRQAMKFQDLKRLPVLLPSLSEQRAIVAFLNRETARIDSLIAKQEQIIVVLQEKRKAIISHSVTRGLDPNVQLKSSNAEWLGMVPARWIVLPLKRLAEISYGLSLELDRTESEGTPIISLPNVTKDGRLVLDEVPKTPLTKEQKKTLLLQKGDLLFNWRNGSADHVGKTAYFDIDGEFTHVSFLLRLRFDLTLHHSRYFQMLLNNLRNTGFFSSSKSMVNNTYNQSELGRLQVMVPPLSEQYAIATYLDHETSKIDTLIAKAQSAINLLKEHRTSLISATVTGKIDVRAL